MPFAGIAVDGLRGLMAACNASDRELRLGVRAALREAAEPVRHEAERLAPVDISNIGPQWSRMRVGVTTQYVYVAPASRRRHGAPRPNLAPLLLDAMETALETEAPRVEATLEAAIDQIAARHW